MGAWSFTPEQRKAAFRSGRFVMDRDSAQAQGCIGWWPLGIHGGNAKDWDYSVFKNHGTRTNGPTRKAVHHPRWGGVHALELASASSQYVDLGDSSLLDFTPNTDPLTIAISVKATTQPGANSVVAGKWVANTQTYGIWITGTDEIAGFIGGDINGLDTGVNLSDEWQHIVVSSDASTARSFVDGDEKNSTTPGGEAVAEWNPVIGRRQSSNDRYFNGLVDDLRIYNRGLSSSLIKQSHNEPWRMVYPLGVRRFSFAPAAAGGTILPQVMQLAS